MHIVIPRATTIAGQQTKRDYKICRFTQKIVEKEEQRNKNQRYKQKTNDKIIDLIQPYR